MNTKALGIVMIITAVGAAACVIISLIAMLLLSWRLDGEIATQAMQSFQAVAQWGLVSGGLWGIAHTVVSNLRPAGAAAVREVAPVAAPAAAPAQA